MNPFTLLKPGFVAAGETSEAPLVDFGRGARERKRAERELYKAEMAECSAFGKIACFIKHHKALSIVAALILATVLSFTMLISHPESAEALPIIPIAIALGSLGAIGAGTAISGGIDELIRNCLNAVIASTNGMLQSLSSADILTKHFDQLFAQIYPIIYEIHHQAVIPIANVVLIIFLLVGLGKVLQEMNRNETAVDFWALCWVFISYAFAKMLIDASFELMVLCYNIVLQLITNVATTAQAAGALGGITGTENLIGDDIKNAGVLLCMLIVAIVAWGVTVLVCVGAQAALIVRAVQIYVYTAYAPIPLAFMVSESSRQMATGFIKKYLATLFAGAIMILLFVMMSAIVSSGGMTNITPTDDGGVVNWICQTSYSLVSIAAFGFCIFRSGTWARDFVGL